jgi:flagellar biogenesis protein FliO
MTLFYDGDMVSPIGSMAPMNIPLSLIVVTMSAFISLILVLYFVLLKYENKMQKAAREKSMFMDMEKN